MASERPFITCHVLDTVSGKPAVGVAVKLAVGGPPSDESQQWTASTNNDGRVTGWSGKGPSVNEQIASSRAMAPKDREKAVWKLTFDTESYFGEGNTFWPEVELKFAVDVDQEHYHVPLLLGPWSYTTYRGS